MERHGKHVIILVLSSHPPTTSAVRFSSVLLTCGLLNLSLRLGVETHYGSGHAPADCLRNIACCICHRLSLCRTYDGKAAPRASLERSDHLTRVGAPCHQPTGTSF